MPLEIRELHIKVTVNAGSSDQAKGGQGAPQKSGQATPSGGSSVNQEELIATCVERVCEILDEKMEA